MCLQHYVIAVNFGEMSQKKNIWTLVPPAFPHRPLHLAQHPLLGDNQLLVGVKKGGK